MQVDNQNERYIMNLLNDFKDKLNGEFEVRFGTFVYNNETKRNKFNSNVEIPFYYNLKRALESQEFKKTIINTTEYIYNIQNESIKKIVNNDTKKVSFMSKTRVSNRDIYDYDIRFALSTENIVNGDKTRTLQPSIVRDKKRISFEIPIGKVDLTIVESNYEVELECNKGVVYGQLMNFINTFIRIRQQNHIIISNYEKRNIVRIYKNLLNLKGNFFIGAQPETLQKQNISQLYKHQYSVTDKADGDRMLLLIDENRNVYFIDNNIRDVYKTNIKSKKYTNCIVDGELMKRDNTIYFYGFDLIMYNKIDLRGNTEFILKTRLDILNDIVYSIGDSNEYIVRMKKFYYNNVFLGAEKLLNETTIKSNPYENDGLIFTPMNEPYPNAKKWSSLLKWKPSELNTIDLYAIKGEDNVWNLYVQHIDKTNDKTTNQKTYSKLELFDVNKLCNTRDNIKELTFQTQIDSSVIDPTTNEPYQTNTVIEFKWDKERSRFVPLRTRWDKTSNKSKHGNFSAVACNIWYNIHNPITKELLFKFTTSKDNFFYTKMRKLHNKIKEYLYNKYLPNTENLLELCSGKGGDIHKWIHNKVQNVHGFDIDATSIKECQRRVESLNLDKNNFKFYELDLIKDDSWKDIIKRTDIQKYDNISCQFAIHYFFQSQKTFDNLIKILDNLLNNGGYFIVTFMDDSQLSKLTHDEKITSKTHDNEMVYYIEQNIESDDKKFFGNNLRIVLSGNNVLTAGSNEWIIQYDKFINEMKHRGYTLVESSLFKDFKHNLSNELVEYEKDISHLNRFSVFQKTGENSQIRVLNNISSPQSLLSFDTINLNNDFSVHKVHTYYDIIDVMNTKSYKYNKFKLDDKEIVTFDDIQQLFDKYIKEYIPIYIDKYDVFDETTNKIYFTYYKHVIESVELGEIEHDNWYIVLYKNKLTFKLSHNIFYKKEEIKDEEVKEEIKDKEVKEEIKDEEVKEKRNIIKRKDKTDSEKVKIDNIKKDIINQLKHEKHTVKLYKNILTSAGLKTSGNKDELIERIKSFLKK